MSLRDFEAWWADGLVAARWVAPCGGVRLVFWPGGSVRLATLRRAATHFDSVGELAGMIGSEPLVYSVTPCDRAGCCIREFPRTVSPLRESGVHAIDRCRASSVPPAP